MYKKNLIQILNKYIHHMFFFTGFLVLFSNSVQNLKTNYKTKTLKQIYTLYTSWFLQVF